MTTLLFEHPIFTTHQVPSGHVERPERVEAIGRRLAKDDLSGLGRGELALADRGDILAVHDADYLRAVEQAIPAQGIVALDADTHVGAASLDVALNAAGASCSAVDAVVSGKAANAFCAIRPPGHHALAGRSMGFCIFNNAAIAARYARRKLNLDRVAIVDWDVHHGNGTQSIFQSDPSVFYGSTHQSPFYPWTGEASETGVGNIVNVPLAVGTSGVAFRAAFDGRIIPALVQFAPDLILISAGFDAHWRDPLGGLTLNETDFAWATQRLMAVAERHCGGRIVSVLEGGYDLDALAESVAAHVAALMT